MKSQPAVSTINIDLTPEVAKIPPVRAWVTASTSAVAPADTIAQQYKLLVGSIREVEARFPVELLLSPASIHAVSWPTPLLRQIYEASHPLASAIATARIRDSTTASPAAGAQPTRAEQIKTASLTETFMLLRDSICGSARVSTNTKSIALSRAITVVHICASAATEKPHRIALSNVLASAALTSAALTSAALTSAALTSATAQPRVQDLVLTHTASAKYSSQFEFANIDQATIKSWRNIARVKFGAKYVDYIVSDYVAAGAGAVTDTTAQIIFIVRALARGGGALLYLPQIKTTAFASAIWLFANCFTKSGLYCTVADDATVLYGSGFLAPDLTKYPLDEYIGTNAGAASALMHPLFDQSVLTARAFVNFVKAIIEYNSATIGGRELYYSDILDTYEHLINSASAHMFPSYVREYLRHAYA